VVNRALLGSQFRRFQTDLWRFVMIRGDLWCLGRPFSPGAKMD